MPEVVTTSRSMGGRVISSKAYYDKGGQRGGKQCKVVKRRRLGLGQKSRVSFVGNVVLFAWSHIRDVLPDDGNRWIVEGEYPPLVFRSSQEELEQHQ